MWASWPPAEGACHDEAALSVAFCVVSCAGVLASSAFMGSGSACGTGAGAAGAGLDAGSSS